MEPSESNPSPEPRTQHSQPLVTTHVYGRKNNTWYSVYEGTALTIATGQPGDLLHDTSNGQDAWFISDNQRKWVPALDGALHPDDDRLDLKNRDKRVFSLFEKKWIYVGAVMMRKKRANDRNATSASASPTPGLPNDQVQPSPIPLPSPQPRRMPPLSIPPYHQAMYSNNAPSPAPLPDIQAPPPPPPYARNPQSVKGPNHWIDDFYQKWERKGLAASSGTACASFKKGEAILKHLASIPHKITLVEDTHPLEYLVDTSQVFTLPNEALVMKDLMEFSGALPVVQNVTGAEKQSTVENFLAALVNLGRNQKLSTHAVPFTDTGLGSLDVRVPEEFQDSHRYLSKKTKTRTEIAFHEVLKSKGIASETDNSNDDSFGFQWFSSITPSGTITDVCQNGVGVTTLVCEINEQSKIWLFWPPSPHNLRTFDEYNSSSQNTAEMTLNCVQHMENMVAYVAVGTEPKTWVLDAGMFYASVALETCYHFAGWLCSIEDWNLAHDLFKRHITTMSHPRFGHIPFRELFQDIQMEVYNWALAISEEEDCESRVRMAEEMKAVMKAVGFSLPNPDAMPGARPIPTSITLEFQKSQQHRNAS